MKLINRFTKCTGRYFHDRFTNLLNELADDPTTYSTTFNGFGSTTEAQQVCFYYSEGECVFMLIDIYLTHEDELIDEEEFCGELPLWFSELSHRVSPFRRIKAMAEAFKISLRNHGTPLPEKILTVLCTNSHLINYDDYEDYYAENDGVVVFNMNTRKLAPRFTPNHNEGEDMINQFANDFNEKQLDEFFHPYYQEKYGDDYKFTDPQVSTHNLVPEEEDSKENYNEFDELLESCISDLIGDKQDDPDFSTIDEGINPETGEKVSMKRNADLPPVTVYEPLHDPQAQLNQMVGLRDMKTHISEILAYAKFNKKLSQEFPQYGDHPINLHTIITGNPGTGKTTVCRIFGGLLHQAGILSRGHTVVASRGSFLGQNFGSEEQRVRQVLKLAQGGCLFIDEAGLLVNAPHPHDPGRGVLQLMLQLLADEKNRDIAVVLAFYANDHSLERLYELNPGIKSRFINVLNFPDYTLDDLIEIARRKARLQGFNFTPTAWKKFNDLLRTGFQNRSKEYGNAREVMNLLQKTLIRHAMRIDRKSLTGNGLLRITAADIPTVEASYIPKPRIGFK